MTSANLHIAILRMQSGYLSSSRKLSDLIWLSIITSFWTELLQCVINNNELNDPLMTSSICIIYQLISQLD